MNNCCRCEAPCEEHICQDCSDACDKEIGNRVMLAEDWMEVAKELDIDLWDRQPSEIDLEWSVWLKYRDSYPFVVKPKMVDIAKDLGVPMSVVKKIYTRWDYDTRLQAWARFVDRMNLDRRQSALVEMNERHISMARKINEKLDVAIDHLNPELMKFSDFKAFMAMATELERKAVGDVKIAEQERVDTRNVSGDKSTSKKADIKKDDMQTVLNILQTAGVLGNTVGVRQVTTTEVISRDD